MVLGDDISTWQDSEEIPGEVNFTKMKDAGIKFTMFKVSQATFTDQVFTDSWIDAKGILPRGGYHWLSWNKTGLEQAKYFCEQIYKDLPEVRTVVDFEDRRGTPYNANGHMWNFLDYVEDQLDIISMIYPSPYFWHEYGTKDKTWTKYPLWIANYYVQQPMIPLPWTTWTMWQYTPKGNGTKYGVESLQIDLDLFNGTEDDFNRFCNKNTQLPEPTHDEKVDILWNEHHPTIGI